MGTWNGTEFRLTVGHCLKLTGDEKTDICANPVQVLLNLRDPAVLLRIAEVTMTTPDADLAEDLDGSGFHSLREAIEAEIVDFFRPDRSSHEFLTELMTLNEKERRTVQAEAIREAREDLKQSKQKENTPQNGNGNPNRIPNGGQLSGNRPDLSVSGRDNGQSAD